MNLPAAISAQGGNEMTLLIIISAAVICTIAAIKKSASADKGIGFLCAVLWLCAALSLCYETVVFIKNGYTFTVPSFGQALHDAYAGLGITAAGIIAWLIVMLIKRRISK